ncbi:cob(I)yrinic acid a,c-diamide adenosyltransferase [uncultured Draconibacterium sp.]|uniref:cob(I)yrinic acid a,c-diamide adenosyltransferase n=1 Tax=uncultured Draconibacterium sp. TaxID=1573823 RepID=UPI0025EA5A31|nr:cob(I)yrinic acid a,c-diamide adenosyltransferase [uncultured Draconibacterium sp.]
MRKGLIHIYTGEGKGKTTAAVGLAIRALGHGFSVVYASFFKKPDLCGYNELKVLKTQGAAVFTFSEGMPLVNPQITPGEYHASTTDGLQKLLDFIAARAVKLVVLDEILIAIKYGYISEDELLSFIKQKPAETELVLTGRGASKRIKDVADYVSVLAKEKHPFDAGVMAREGIEY